MGVGALSTLVPMLNAELSPPGIRGSLVALQQLSITCELLPFNGRLPQLTDTLKSRYLDFILDRIRYQLHRRYNLSWPIERGMANSLEPANNSGLNPLYRSCLSTLLASMAHAQEP